MIDCLKFGKFLAERGKTLMAFGSTLVNQQTQTATEFNSEPIFLNVKDGVRVIRILGAEKQVKVQWLDGITISNKDGKKVTGKRPFIVAVLQDGRWVGDAPDYRQNVIDLHYNTLYGEPFDDSNENKKKRQLLLPKQRFYVNVLDRTPVHFDNEGTIIYPNGNGEYPKGYSEDEAKPHNKVLILEGSAGKEGGKHFLQQIVTTSKNLVSFQTGKKITLEDSDLRIITVRGSDPTGKDTVRTPMPGFDQNPLPEELASLPLFDLDEFAKPWPNEALQEILSGAEYGEVAKRYNVILFPRKASVKDETFDEEPPF